MIHPTSLRTGKEEESDEKGRRHGPASSHTQAARCTDGGLEVKAYILRRPHHPLPPFCNSATERAQQSSRIWLSGLMRRENLAAYLLED